ncbi:MAG TPA: hypothetical protein VGJ20_26265 [Xanthobacteraceae bacterium]
MNLNLLERLRRVDSLSAAGFLVKPATTPERQAMLQKLPPNRFIQRASGESVHYVYADRLSKNASLNQLVVGSIPTLPTI